MTKELQQNIAEVLNVFKRIESYPYDEMKEFYKVVSDKLEELDVKRIEKGDPKTEEDVKRLLNSIFTIR